MTEIQIICNLFWTLGVICHCILAAAQYCFLIKEIWLYCEILNLQDRPKRISPARSEWVSLSMLICPSSSSHYSPHWPCMEVPSSVWVITLLSAANGHLSECRSKKFQIWYILPLYNVTFISAFWHFAECTGMALIQVLSLTVHSILQGPGSISCGQHLDHTLGKFSPIHRLCLRWKISNAVPRTKKTSDGANFVCRSSIQTNPDDLWIIWRRRVKTVRNAYTLTIHDQPTGWSSVFMLVKC